jgi:hypothetical protein
MPGQWPRTANAGTADQGRLLGLRRPRRVAKTARAGCFACFKSKTRESPARARDTFRPGRSPLPPRSLCPLSLPPLSWASCLRLSTLGGAARLASSSGLLRLALRRVSAYRRSPLLRRRELLSSPPPLRIGACRSGALWAPLSTYAQDATLLRGRSRDHMHAMRTTKGTSGPGPLAHDVRDHPGTTTLQQLGNMKHRSKRNQI